MKGKLRDVQAYQEAGVEAMGIQKLELVVHLKDENDNTSGSTDPVYGFPAKHQEPGKNWPRLSWR